MHIQTAQSLRILTLLFLFSLSCNFTWAHNINLALEEAPTGDVVWYYMRLGILHIIPNGFDHILFIIALCLLNNKIKIILLQATAFTVAHSITLAMSMKGVVTLPSEIVEPLIALSILFVALENLLIGELKAWRILIVFMFGLIHGLGFASALNEIGLPRNRFYTAIVSFNAGVELGQIMVILLVYLLLILPFGKSAYYKRRVVYPITIMIGLVAAYWTIERIF